MGSTLTPGKGGRTIAAMAHSGAGSLRALGGMQPDPALLGSSHETELVRADGRPQPGFREDLRRIPSGRNAVSVLSAWVQIVGVIALAVWWGNPVGYVLAFLLVARADAQFAALMHEAAHRLLFSNRRLNDFVGRWIVGYPIFTSTDAYRRVHMAHHRHEFGPDEPDIPLYSGYPITGASFRRKLVRDATGQTAVRLFRELFAIARWKDSRSRRVLLQILVVQAILLGVAIMVGRWWLYPLLWLLPYMTVWRVINRLRAIAEHGGMDESTDRRETTHTVEQHWLARFWLVPYHIGWHLAHHVDAGIPMNALPRYHRALIDAGYVTPEIEYSSYPAVWKALRAG
jgi:fatty acid desaturase